MSVSYTETNERSSRKSWISWNRSGVSAKFGSGSFGKSRNMTIANRLTKDPPVAGLVSLAERIHEQWQAADKSTALEQRAAAEEALKKLAEAAAWAFHGWTVSFITGWISHAA
jgi:hypothetical protein